MLCKQYLFKVIRKSTIMYMRQFVAAAESVRQHCCEVVVLVPPALNPLGLHATARASTPLLITGRV